jgi:hypothetical protein
MINNNTRFLGIDSTKVDLTKKKDETNNAVGSYYTLDEMAALPVETTYPVTNAAEAGKKFLYLGTEWQYMTQAQIDSTGWTGLVSVGFPAPVSRIPNIFVLAPNAQPAAAGTDGVPMVAPALFNPADLGIYGEIYDLLGTGNPTKVHKVTLSTGTATSVSIIKNAQLLTNLEDSGTSPAFSWINSGTTAAGIVYPAATAAQINDFFTQLPSTTKTATINISAQPNKAGATTSIATNKGYTVTT